MATIIFRICPTCGLVNQADVTTCSFCSCDLSETGKQRKNFSGFNPVGKYFYDGDYHDEPSSSLDEILEAKKAESSEILETPAVDEEMYCPTCMTTYSLGVVGCPKCFRRLQRRPKEKHDSKPIETLLAQEEPREKTYSLLIDDKVLVPAKFVDGVFAIGRSHQEYFETFLFKETPNTISNDHCYIKKIDGNFYLYEDEANPSTNHTFIKKNKRFIKINPGDLIPLELGDTFMVFAVKVSLIENDVC